MGRFLILLALLVVSFGAATAAGESMDARVSSSRPVGLEGSLDAELPGGRAWILNRFADGSARIEGATGRVTIWTWDTLTEEAVVGSPALALAGMGNSTGYRGADMVDDARSTSFNVDNATLVVEFATELFESVLVGSRDATLAISGAVAGPAKPAWLERRMEPPATVQTTPYTPPGQVSYELEKGWAYIGNLTYAEERRGPPSLDWPTVSITGDAQVSLFGGNLTVEDETSRRETRLGAWSRDSTSVATPGVHARIVRKQLAIFEGTIERAEIPAGAKWSAGGPRILWHLDGTAVWRAAEFESATRDGVLDDTGSDVVVRGAGVIEPRPPGTLAILESDSYTLSGDWEILVDGVRLDDTRAEPAVSPAVAAGGLAGIALLVTLLTSLPWKLAAALYTRLGRDDILSHPMRQRILDVAIVEPGVHQSEAFRRVGGAWGPFTFHLRVLIGTGHLRVERRGKFSLLFPADAPHATLPPSHPISRAVYDLVPEGTPGVRVAELANRLGHSRQLVAYHLRRLETAGFVQVAAEAEGLRAWRPDRAARASIEVSPRQEERKPFLPNS